MWFPFCVFLSCIQNSLAFIRIPKYQSSNFFVISLLLIKCNGSEAWQFYVLNWCFLEIHLWESEGHMITFISGASRVRVLPPEQFCRHGFVLGKSSEAGFGNEMYKVLTAATLSIMLNRSLIIGQTRHIGLFSSLSVLCYRVAFIILPGYHMNSRKS